MSSSQITSNPSTPDQTIQNMFKQLLTGQRSNEAGIQAMSENMTARWNECLERWQAIDIRTTKLEDDMARSEHQTVKLNETIGHNTNRITSLEDDVRTIRSDLNRLVTQPNPTPPANDTTRLPTHTPAPPDMSQGF